MNDDEEHDSRLALAALFLAILGVLLMLCGCTAAGLGIAGHPGQIALGWLLAQFLTLTDMLALIFGV